MVGLSAHKSEQAQGDSEGQGGLACYIQSMGLQRHDSMTGKQQKRNIIEVGKHAGIEFLKISTGNSHVF